MKIHQVPTLRNGAPCSAVEIDVDLVTRISSAFSAGALIRLGYTNLQGVIQYRNCYVEAVYSNLFYIVVKHRDFGYRTVFLERIVSLG